MAQFEKEIIEYLGLPSIPKKEWDGTSSFAKGVALVELHGEQEAYAVASFDATVDKEPNIVKVFGIEPFKSIKKVFVVPVYMSTEEEVNDMDLDEQSKKKAKEILKEASEIENDGVESDIPSMDDLPEYIFPEIHNKQEAEAWLRRYNSMNKIKGKLPQSEDTIKLRLFSIYTELKNKMK